MTDDQLKTSAEISLALLNKATIEESYHRRVNEWLKRTEAKQTKKRFNTVTLSVIGAMIILACTLIVVQITTEFLTYEYAMPIILIALLVAVGVMFAIDYFSVRKKGTELLVTKLESKEKWEKVIKELMRSNTKIYNYVKKAFDSVLPIESKYTLNSFIFRYYVTAITSELEIPHDNLYKYLYTASSKKNLKLELILAEDETFGQVKELILPHLAKFILVLDILAKSEHLPAYYKERIAITKENIDLFKARKVEAVEGK